MAEENLNEKDEEKTQGEQAEQTAQNEEAAAGDGPSTGSGTTNGSDAPDPSTSSGTPETPEEKIAALEKEIADLKTQALYKAAENDNWRKRMMQQKDEAVAYANASLLGDLLDSLDNFDRTLDAAKDAKDAKSIADGIKMINKSLVKMLEDKYGLVSYGKEGDEFNPEEHEAIGRQEDEKAKKETLAQVYLKGYKLKDKVIRHAKVMVKVPKN
ncbi:MAG: nucleotide exchange factor GrpE [Treponema sp.]|jgi:molecular chaperone GrpE|nr:nucleotide exchange factor GrpE [Treponema sp.]